MSGEATGTSTVRLHHLTNLASDEAARFLAAQLNATRTVYPGTNLRKLPSPAGNCLGGSFPHW
jgi:hypothetical protein